MVFNFTRGQPCQDGRNRTTVINYLYNTSYTRPNITYAGEISSCFYLIDVTTANLPSNCSLLAVASPSLSPSPSIGSPPVVPSPAPPIYGPKADEFGWNYYVSGDPCKGNLMGSAYHSVPSAAVYMHNGGLRGYVELSNIDSGAPIVATIV